VALHSRDLRLVENMMAQGNSLWSACKSTTLQIQVQLFCVARQHKSNVYIVSNDAMLRHGPCNRLAVCLQALNV
jgi:hypothetical protein